MESIGFFQTKSRVVVWFNDRRSFWKPQIHKDPILPNGLGSWSSNLKVVGSGPPSADQSLQVATDPFNKNDAYCCPIDEVSKEKDNCQQVDVSSSELATFPQRLSKYYQATIRLE